MEQKTTGCQAIGHAHWRRGGCCRKRKGKNEDENGIAKAINNLGEGIICKVTVWCSHRTFSGAEHCSESSLKSEWHNVRYKCSNVRRQRQVFSTRENNNLSNVLWSCSSGSLCRSTGPRTPTPPPPPQGASSQQLVVKGTGLRSRWVPQVPNCPQAPKSLPSALELG